MTYNTSGIGCAVCCHGIHHPQVFAQLLALLFFSLAHYYYYYLYHGSIKHYSITLVSYIYYGGLEEFQGEGRNAMPQLLLRVNFFIYFLTVILTSSAKMRAYGRNHQFAIPKM